MQYFGSKVLANNRPNNGDDGIWNRIGRFLRYKLVIPMKRSPHSPEYTARGVYWGVFWGLTPLVGIQMPIVTAQWLIFRLHPATAFHIIPGLAWVWISNVFTMVPMYYVFYVTGQLMIGRFKGLSGYDSFAKLLDFKAWEEDTFWETVAHYFSYVWEQFGLPLVIGWVPWALVIGWVAYKVSLQIIRQRREKILARRLRQSKKLLNDDTRPDSSATAGGPAE